MSLPSLKKIYKYSNCMFLLFLFSLVPAISPAAASLAPGSYRIISAAGKDFDLNLKNGVRDNGVNIELDQRRKNGTDLFQFQKVSGEYFRIKSLLSGRVLSIDNEENVVLSKWSNAKNKLWKAQSDSSGRFFLISGTGKYLGIENKKAEAGANVCAKKPTSKTWAKWILEPAAEVLTVSAKETTFSPKSSSTGITVFCAGSWKARCSSKWISLKKTGSRLIITVKKNNGKSRTANITVTSGSLSRTITVTQKSKKDSVGTKSIKNGTYYFVSALGEGRYGLSVHKGKKKNGVNVEINQLQNTPSQQFTLKYVSDGAYRILAKHTGKCLEVDGITANIQQWEYQGYHQQLWIPEDAGNGYYYLRSKESGLYLSVCQKTAGEEVNVIAKKGKSSKAQRWKLYKPEEICPGYRYFWKSCGKKDVTDEFLEKTLRISRAIGADPDNLMAVMAFESSLDHTAVNPNSGATGLIQFLPSTASNLGTSTASLKAMSAVNQLDYVYMYLSSYSGRISSLGSLYMSVLWPYAVGQPDSYVLWRSGGIYNAQYTRNKGLDVNHDGAVTVGESVQSVLKQRMRFVGA